MLKAIKKLVPGSLKSYLRSNMGASAFANTSYSQEGEDLLLARIFNDGKAGHYVDVGAHHPFRFSNTYLFYKKGWCGINIDAMPGSMKSFRRYRHRDVNLEIGISLKPRTLEFHTFSEPAFNTFDAELAEARARSGHRILKRIMVQCQPLGSILEHSELVLDGGNSFLTIDVEGLDVDVLRSNNWKRFRPSFVIVEMLGENLDNVLKSETTIFLRSQGYVPFSKLNASVVFKRDDYEII